MVIFGHKMSLSTDLGKLPMEGLSPNYNQTVSERMFSFKEFLLKKKIWLETQLEALRLASFVH